jgi:hypothetical protein
MVVFEKAIMAMAKATPIIGPVAGVLLTQQKMRKLHREQES